MKGKVVVVPFPFSDLSGTKHRPALVLIDLPGDDAVMAAITSTGSGPHVVPLSTGDFQAGRLPHASFIQPTKLFTFEKQLIVDVMGTINESKRREVVTKIQALLS